MTKNEAKKLKHGLARLFWKSGGTSLAVVGSLHDGTRWFAAANWTGQTTGAIASTAWRLVERTEMLHS